MNTSSLPSRATHVPSTCACFRVSSGVIVLFRFNYDDIADYSLYWAGKLTRLSFQGLGFEEIILPSPGLSSEPGGRLNKLPEFMERFNSVKFLKVHGSFNWWAYFDETQHRADDWIYPVSSAPYLCAKVLREGQSCVTAWMHKAGPRVGRTGLRLQSYFRFWPKEAPIYRANAMFGRHLTRLSVRTAKCRGDIP